jgi:hypothetical protein
VQGVKELVDVARNADAIDTSLQRIKRTRRVREDRVRPDEGVVRPGRAESVGDRHSSDSCGKQGDECGVVPASDSSLSRDSQDDGDSELSARDCMLGS